MDMSKSKSEIVSTQVSARKDTKPNKFTSYIRDLSEDEQEIENDQLLDQIEERSISLHQSKMLQNSV